ncbi:MAG TPA: VWA domain-containing protein [Opitutaceae bacterium]|nr:VWA domain-containing protein [Opitutaceae bacterium]
MSFYWPHVLWLLFVPIALPGWDLTRRRKVVTGSAIRPKILHAEVGADHVSLTTGAATPPANRIRPWFLLGLAFAIVALARPQWGRIEEPVFDQSREILIAMDLSRSMMSTDIKPSRLERSKLLIQTLLEKLKGERVGLVVFSGTAFLQSPLSSDYEILREFLPSLNPGFLPEGGTNYRAMIDTALDAFGTSTAADRFLIVLSDGEATDDDWKSRVDDLKKKGVRVIGLGVGTAAGSMIPDGSGGFVKDERGAVVLSKLESSTLQQLASETGGAYRDASTWVDLASLIQQTVNAGRKGSFVEKNTVRYVERFQWPLGLAVWCLLVSLYYEFPVRPRPRDIRLQAGKPQPGSGEPPPLPPRTAAPAGGIGLVALAALALLFPPSPSRAAVKIATPEPSTSPGTPAPETPPPPTESTVLSRIVTRLANSATRNARDWADLARETVTWGGRLQSAQKPVPAGPVHDAMDAVAIGSKLDANAADWPKLHRDLEALLKKPEPPPQQKQQNQKQQNKSPQQNQQNQNQKNQNESQKSSPDQSQANKSSGAPQNQPSKSADDRSKQGEKPEASGKPEHQKSDQSLFGDMKKPPVPAPDPSQLQKVGGTEQKKENAQAAANPALALPLEKLDQLRQQDSPAQLFQMLQGDRSQATRKQPAKNW